MEKTSKTSERPKPPSGPREKYADDRRATLALLGLLDRRHLLVANGRLVVFALAAGLGGAVALAGVAPRVLWLAAAALAAYLGLAIWHRRISAALQRARARLAFDERGLARLDGKWHDLPGRGERFLRPEHLNAPDLDSFGQGSLFQLLNETPTQAGEQRLAQWLAEPASAAVAARRQAAVRELAERLEFRRALVVESQLEGRDKLDPTPFAAWSRRPAQLASITWARHLPLVLPPLTLTAYLLQRSALLPPWVFALALVAQIVVVARTRRPLGALFDGLSLGEGGLGRLRRTFMQIERERFSDDLLRELASGIAMADGGERALVSHRLAALERLYGFAEARRTQFHPVLNLLLLWDLFFLFRIERWRLRHGAAVVRWVEALADLEALAALAGLAHDRPEYAFPRFSEGPPRFVARALGHPLLDAPVRNDFALEGPGRALLITGSNMSGKSTLLRAVGVNAVLALAGGPVCAEALELSELVVLTSMRVKDSLERGVSYFYAEVQRLKALLDAAQAHGGRALFLLDEVLLGTNTRERQLASRQVLLLLLETGAIGAVTTHDLSLTQLEEDLGGRVRNGHFRDLLIDERMTFDYKLRPGVVETSNALRVMRAVGIPVEAEG